MREGYKVVIVDDMRCSGCVERITELLKPIGLLSDFDIKLEEKSVSFTAEDLDSASINVLSVLSDAGYQTDLVV